MKKKNILMGLLVASSFIALASCGKDKKANDNKDTTTEVTTSDDSGNIRPIDESTTSTSTVANTTTTQDVTTTVATTTQDVTTTSINTTTVSNVTPPNDVTTTSDTTTTLETTTSTSTTVIPEKITVTMEFGDFDHESIDYDVPTNGSMPVSFTVPDLSDILDDYSGYYFVGWVLIGDSGYFQAGETVTLDDNATFVAAFDEYTYTFNDTSSLEHDGKKIYTCNEDDTKSYEVEVKKEDIFASYLSDATYINGKGTVLITTIKQGTIKIGDKIDVTLSDQSVISEVEVLNIDYNHTEVDSATKGQYVGLLVNDSRFTKNDVSAGSLICETGKMIQNVTSIYVKMYLNTKAEGGRSNPVFENYRPVFNVGTFSTQVKTSEIYYYNKNKDHDAYKRFNTADEDMATTGNTYIFRLDIITVPSLMTWIGEEITITEGDLAVGKGTVIARTQEQLDDYFNYYDVNVYTGKYHDYDYETIRVAKNTNLSDIECTFTYDGYEFLCWQPGAAADFGDPNVIPEGDDKDEWIELTTAQEEETIIDRPMSIMAIWLTAQE